MIKTLTNGRPLSRLILFVILVVIQIVLAPLASASPLLEAIHAAVFLVSLFLLINFVI